MKFNKYLAEVVVFFLLLSIGLMKLYDIVRYKDTGSGGGTDNFYSIDVPLDVIVFGSSHAACTVNNGILWNEYGIASYTFTAGAQKSDGTTYFVEEAIAHNKPEIALVETYLLADEGYEEGAFFRTALTTKFSSRYVKYIFEVAKRNNFGREMIENLFFRMPMVHSRYKELSKDDFSETEEYMVGYRGSNEVTPFDAPDITSDTGEVSEKALENIDRIIKVCRDNNVEPIFFAAPYVASQNELAQQNAIKQYVENQGCQYLDYLQKYQDYGIDFSCDFRDFEHLNDWGAEKITRAIIKDITEKHIFTDKRYNVRYERWDKHVRFLEDRKAEYELKKCHEIGEYEQALLKYKDDLTFVISLNGNYRALGDEVLEPFLLELGLGHDNFEAGGDFTVYGEYKKVFVNQNIQDSSGLNGIKILVKDDRIGYVVDSIYVDVYEGVNVKRD